MTEVKQREARRAEIRQRLQTLDQQSNLQNQDRSAIEPTIRSVLKEWRAVLGKQLPRARQIVSKLLEGRLSVTPERRNGTQGFRLTGSGSFLRFLSEVSIPALQQVASPTGFEPVFWP